MIAQRSSLLFLVLLGITYAACRWARSRFDLPLFFEHHFTDLLFIPFQLTLSLVILRWLKRDNALRIPVHLVLLVVICMIGLFEWYMPHYGSQTQRFTADGTDSLMYAMGGAAYLCCQRWFLTKPLPN